MRIIDVREEVEYKDVRIKFDYTNDYLFFDGNFVAINGAMGERRLCHTDDIDNLIKALEKCKELSK